MIAPDRIAAVGRAAVVGAGSWGTTIANLLAGRGVNVHLWAREPELVDAMRATGENVKYVPGVPLHPGLRAERRLDDMLEGTTLVVFAIPTQSLREIARIAAPNVSPEALIVNLAKGLEHGTGARCSEILRKELGGNPPIAALSGPNIAHEVIRGIPSKAVVSCDNFRYLGGLKQLFTTPCFKVYENPDLTGTELAGALKNVVSIMAGIGDGLGFGANTKAAVVTRGLREMVKAGVMMGGNRDTFFGLAGIGDLMATASSPHSRNRTLGELLGRGLCLADAEAGLGGRVAEGIETTRAFQALGAAFRLEMPIVETLHEILFDRLPAREGFMAIWNPGADHEFN